MKVLNDKQKGLCVFLDEQIKNIDKDLATIRQKIKNLNSLKSLLIDIKKEIK